MKYCDLHVLPCTTGDCTGVVTSSPASFSGVEDSAKYSSACWLRESSRVVLKSSGKSSSATWSERSTTTVAGLATRVMETISATKRKCKFYISCFIYLHDICHHQYKVSQNNSWNIIWIILTSCWPWGKGWGYHQRYWSSLCSIDYWSCRCRIDYTNCRTWGNLGKYRHIWKETAV